MTHLLDRPVWSALASGQAFAARAEGNAVLMNADYGPFAAAHNDDPGSLEALASMVSDERRAGVVLMQVDPIVVPGELGVIRTASGVQLVWSHGGLAAQSTGIDLLGDSDADEMLALARLTAPGPFERSTRLLGTFVGIRREGKLVAMAGERLRLDGFAEVSAVCTHPSWRGQGLAAALTVSVASRILDRGETPFLHAYASNTGAIRLYERLGFRHRDDVNVAVVSVRSS